MGYPDPTATDVGATPARGKASAWYYLAGGGGITTAIRPEATLEAQAIQIPTALTADRLCIDVTVVGSAGAVIRLGIYEMGSNGLPGALTLDAGTVNAASGTGVKEITISQALTAGWYFLAAVNQGAPGTRATTRTRTTPGMGELGNSAVATLFAFPSNGVYLSAVTGALPDPFGTPTAATRDCHVVGIRFA